MKANSFCRAALRSGALLPASAFAGAVGIFHLPARPLGAELSEDFTSFCSAEPSWSLLERSYLCSALPNVLITLSPEHTSKQSCHPWFCNEACRLGGARLSSGSPFRAQSSSTQWVLEWAPATSLLGLLVPRGRCGHRGREECTPWGAHWGRASLSGLCPPVIAAGTGTHPRAEGETCSFSHTLVVSNKGNTSVPYVAHHCGFKKLYLFKSR